MSMTAHAAMAYAICVLTLTATGCAGGLGANRYACDGLPSRPLCLSTAAIYHLTEHDGPPPAERPEPEEARR
jgi:hypothetical protein